MKPSDWWSTKEVSQSFGKIKWSGDPIMKKESRWKFEDR